eukprot:gene12299-8440_t
MLFSSKSVPPHPYDSPQPMERSKSEAAAHPVAITGVPAEAAHETLHPLNLESPSAQRDTTATAAALLKGNSSEAETTAARDAPVVGQDQGSVDQQQAEQGDAHAAPATLNTPQDGVSALVGPHPGLVAELAVSESSGTGSSPLQHEVESLARPAKDEAIGSRTWQQQRHNLGTTSTAANSADGLSIASAEAAVHHDPAGVDVRWWATEHTRAADGRIIDAAALRHTPLQRDAMPGLDGDVALDSWVDAAAAGCITSTALRGPGHGGVAAGSLPGVLYQATAETSRAVAALSAHGVAPSPSALDAAAPPPPRSSSATTPSRLPPPHLHGTPTATASSTLGAATPGSSSSGGAFRSPLPLSGGHMNSVVSPIQLHLLHRQQDHPYSGTADSPPPSTVPTGRTPLGQVSPKPNRLGSPLPAPLLPLSARQQQQQHNSSTTSLDISLTTDSPRAPSTGRRGTGALSAKPGSRPPPSPARCPSPLIQGNSSGTFGSHQAMPPLPLNVMGGTVPPSSSSVSSARSSFDGGRGRSPREFIRETVWVGMDGALPYVPTHLEQHRRTTPRRNSETEDDEVYNFKPPTPTVCAPLAHHGQSLSVGSNSVNPPQHPPPLLCGGAFPPPHSHGYTSGAGSSSSSVAPTTGRSPRSARDEIAAAGRPPSVPHSQRSNTSAAGVAAGGPVAACHAPHRHRHHPSQSSPSSAAPTSATATTAARQPHGSSPIGTPAAASLAAGDDKSSVETKTGHTGNEELEAFLLSSSSSSSSGSGRSSASWCSSLPSSCSGEQPPAPPQPLVTSPRHLNNSCSHRPPATLEKATGHRPGFHTATTQTEAEESASPPFSSPSPTAGDEAANSPPSAPLVTSSTALSIAAGTMSADKPNAADVSPVAPQLSLNNSSGSHHTGTPSASTSSSEVPVTLLQEAVERARRRRAEQQQQQHRKQRRGESQKGCMRCDEDETERCVAAPWRAPLLSGERESLSSRAYSSTDVPCTAVNRFLVLHLYGAASFSYIIAYSFYVFCSPSSPSFFILYSFFLFFSVFHREEEREQEHNVMPALIRRTLPTTINSAYEGNIIKYFRPPLATFSHTGLPLLLALGTPSTSILYAEAPGQRHPLFANTNNRKKNTFDGRRREINFRRTTQAINKQTTEKSLLEKYTEEKQEGGKRKYISFFFLNERNENKKNNKNIINNKKILLLKLWKEKGLNHECSMCAVLLSLLLKPTSQPKKIIILKKTITTNSASSKAIRFLPLFRFHSTTEQLEETGEGRGRRLPFVCQSIGFRISAGPLSPPSLLRPVRRGAPTTCPIKKRTYAVPISRLMNFHGTRNIERLIHHPAQISSSQTPVYLLIYFYLFFALPPPLSLFIDRIWKRLRHEKNTKYEHSRSPYPINH